MIDISALKALSRETKALILVSEFEARRMPLFQLRAVLDTIVRDDEEKKTIVDMVENDLRATGYPPEQIAAFLSDLLTIAPPKPITHEGAILTTRKLRSPFALGFEGPPPPDVPTQPAEQEAHKLLRGATLGPGFLRSGALSGSAPPEHAAGRPHSAQVPPAPHAPPAKPTAPPLTGSGPQRRNSFVFEPGARP